MVGLLIPITREISVTDKLEFSFKSLTLLIKVLVMRVFRPVYFLSFYAARIPCFCRSFHRLFSNSAIPERVVAISLFVGDRKKMKTIVREEFYGLNFCSQQTIF
jgi:hypothetical protein